MDKPTSPAGISRTAIDTQEQTGADVFLDILRNFGVEYIFSSPGTEWAPLWESLARQKALGMAGPEFLVARHEDLAIGMATGYSKATGKLSICLVHCSVGTFRVGMGVRGAYQEHVPMLVCAGEAITLGEGDNAWVGFHWGRYLEDYGGPARILEPVVKSTFALNAQPLLAASAHRACQLAMASPPGPVFLSLPFEYMAGVAECAAPPVDGFPAQPQVNAQQLAAVAEVLASSRSPVIITEKIGKSVQAVADLVTLAESINAVVVEAQHPEYVNFPRKHALHGGFNAAPYLHDADVVLLLDMIGPAWYPETAMRPAQAKIIAIGEDPLRARVPYHAAAADIALAGRADDAVAALIALLPEGEPTTGERRTTLKTANDARRDEWHAMAQQHASTTPIDARWLCEELNTALPDNAILVDETILTNFTMLHVMDALKPGQFINAMNGGLGTGLGAALGVKVANPERPVIVMLGDGGFNYNPPLAAVGFCQEYQCPITVIICDNGRWRAMQMVTEQLYPDGHAKQTDNYYGSYIAPQINYASMAGMVGGHGELITEPNEIKPAVQRALKANADGRVAILDVIIGDEMDYLGPMMKDSH